MTSLNRSNPTRIWNSIAAICGFACLTLGVSTTAQAQQNGQPAVSTTVQQPVVSSFSVRTVVSAPDGGRIALGGVSSSAAGGAYGGIPMLGNIPWLGRPFRNRGLGSTTRAGGASLGVRIISNKEIEEDILALANHREQFRESTDPNGPKAVQRKADFLSKHIGGTKKR